mmetsp:Transcript_24573/g.39845  ORF Transcript_24573/g.39845 Transcript_24573/m.39845 type:complete len:88 (-) Transcript_24573:1207-1470(-)
MKAAANTNCNNNSQQANSSTIHQTMNLRLSLADNPGSWSILRAHVQMIGTKKTTGLGNPMKYLTLHMNGNQDRFETPISKTISNVLQ